MNAVRLAGFEERGKKPVAVKGSAGNTTKLEESLSRSRATVFELAMCNPWEYFVTLTLDKEKYDRYNLDTYKKALTKWLNNNNYRGEQPIKYLLIPEPHKDGAWHIHALMMGIPPEQLVAFTLTDNIPERLKNYIRQGREVMNWIPYCEKFGWVTVELIRDRESCAKYIMKYISKNLLQSLIELNNHVYYASQGLMRAEVVYRDYLIQNFIPDYENEYVRVKYFENIEDAISLFCDKVE